MVIGAQIGDGPNVSVLVLLVQLLFNFFIFFSNVVDTRLVPLAVSVDHRSSIMSTRVVLSLHVALFLTVATHDVGIAGAIAADRGGVDSRGTSRGGVEIARRLLTADGCNLLNFFIGELIPENSVGLIGLQSRFDRSNFLRSFAVILDGLNFPRELHALHECSLAGLKDLVADGVLDSGQEQLVLEEEGHVINALSLGLVDGGAGKSDDSHGGGLVVYEAVIGNLYPAAVVVHRFFRVLLKVSEVGANGLGGVLGLESVQKLLFDVVPDGKVDIVIF
jgi:hypothetical protein